MSLMLGSSSRLFQATFITVAMSVSLMACSNAETNNTSVKKSESVSKNSSTSQSVVPHDNVSDVVTVLQNNLQKSGIDEKIISAVPTDMPNIYWVTPENASPFFADKEGKYIIQGQIIQVGESNPVDITAKLASRNAKDKLALVEEKDMIIYPAEGEKKAVIYAFTDPTCPYCQKLHEEVPAMNKKGIEVRYLAWPRNESGIPLVEAVWCSEDRKAALRQAKAGMNVQAPHCENPVQKQIDLGFSLGVRGTPAVFTEDGQQVGGYLTANQMAERLGI